MWAALLFSFMVEPQKTDEALIQRLEKSLVEKLETEVLRAQRLTSLTSEQSDTVVDQVRSHIARYAKSLVQQLPKGPNTPDILPNELSTKVGEQIEGLLGLAARTKYQQDISKRRQLYLDAIVGLTVTMIDHRLNLTKQQHAQVKQMLVRDWKLAEFCERAGLSEDLRPIDREGHTLPFGFPEPSLLELLSEPQKAAWRFHQRRWRENPALFKTIDKPVTNKADFVNMLQMHSEILAEQLKLPDTQTRKLKLLARKCGQQAHRLQTEAHAFLAEKVPDEPSTAELIIWEASYSADPELARCRTDWQQLVLTVLSEPQRNMILNRRANRNRATHAAWAANQAHMLGRVYHWTGNESIRMFELFLQAPVESNGALTTSKRSAFCARIPEETLSSVLTGPGFNNMRSWQAFIARFHKNTKLD